MSDSMPNNGRRSSLANKIGKLFPRSLPPRLYLIVFAVFIQTCAAALSWFAVESRNPGLIFISVTVWLIWFALVFLIAISKSDNILHPHRDRVRMGAIIALALLIIIGLGEIVFFHAVNTNSASAIVQPERFREYFGYGDDTGMTQQGINNLLVGVNPYTHPNIISACKDFNISITKITPLRQGDFANVYPYPTEEQLEQAGIKAKALPNQAPKELLSEICYPPGALLLPAPFIALGLTNIKFFYLLCALIMMMVVCWKCPKSVRPLVVLVFLANVVLWNDIASGRTDSLYVLFILLGWISRRHLLLSSVLMGIAATTKQIAWVYILFYLVLQLREFGWKHSLKQVAVIMISFVLINIPFAIDAPKAWLESVFAETTNPYFPAGVGIVTFSFTGILPFNQTIFTIMEAVILLLSLIWYYYNCRKYPYTGIVLAALPFFFAWHSYSRYFYFTALLVFALVAIEEYRRPNANARPQLTSAVSSQ